MTYGELLELQNAGAFKVKYDNEMNAIVGGVKLTSTQCDKLAEQFGWKEHWVTGAEAISKINTLINGIKNTLNSESAMNLEVIMTNTRKQDSEKTVDRFRFINNKGINIAILTGLGGTGGRYSIFSKENHFAKAIASFNTLKSTGEYINLMLEL